ncbi:hypothetical protein V9T40_003352 [Parthenolecanium corni]|uniref:Translation initiation factor eIF2B subunit epsilon n=1 Tax=Parthenolecanium corni TaxID=536013 RepID=A0AAN9U2J1_9HEMI
MKANLEKEGGLQAVIVADTFNRNFEPASSCCSLLPLVNVKLLDYTLEWLNMSGVDEVILFCSSHVNEIKLHLKDKVYLSIDVKVLVSENCYSLGDVMRSLDGYAVIRNTFILLSADVIGNVNFVPLVEKFKSIQSVDKEISMMVLFKEVGNQRPELHNDFIVAHNSKNRIIHYQVQKSKNIELPMEVLLEQEFVDIRNNLLNPGLAICSVAVPPLFSENFDFQTISDFIRGLLMNEEILKCTVYGEILKGNQYVARVRDWPMYQVISQDIIRRWLYPIVPDLLDKYSYKKNSTYVNNATFSKGFKLGVDVVVGAKTKLGKNVRIDRSVIGNNCTIGENVVVENSYIFDNVKIEENCAVRNSVISHTCVVKRNSIIDSCVIGPCITLNAESKVNKKSLVSKKLTHKENLAPFSDNCYVYANSDSEDEESSALVTDWAARTNFVYDDSTSDSDTETVSVDEALVEDDDVNIFYNEVEDSLSRGFSEKLQCENLVLEVNSSRYVYNVTVSEVNFNVIRAILNINLSDAGNAKQMWQHMESKLKYFLPIIRNYIKDSRAQRDCLAALEDVTASYGQLKMVLVKIINYMYDKDVLAEEAIVAWYNELSNEEIKTCLLSFIQWLNEAEEESDEESD